MANSSGAQGATNVDADSKLPHFVISADAPSHRAQIDSIARRVREKSVRKFFAGFRLVLFIVIKT